MTKDDLKGRPGVLFEILDHTVPITLLASTFCDQRPRRTCEQESQHAHTHTAAAAPSESGTAQLLDSRQRFVFGRPYKSPSPSPSPSLPETLARQ
jgi:hypothetical protein